MFAFQTKQGKKLRSFSEKIQFRISIEQFYYRLAFQIPAWHIFSKKELWKSFRGIIQGNYSEKLFKGIHNSIEVQERKILRKGLQFQSEFPVSSRALEILSLPARQFRIRNTFQNENTIVSRFLESSRCQSLPGLGWVSNWFLQSHRGLPGLSAGHHQANMLL